MRHAQINGERLFRNLMALGRIGEDAGGGVTRLSMTKEDLAAREWLYKHMEELELEVHTDPIGNVIGRWPGYDPDAPTVMTGSHIDTVRQGGRFDGALGVLGALEAVRTMKEFGFVPHCGIEVVSFTDEEGARFANGLIGSKAMTGLLGKEELAGLRDSAGIGYEKALRDAGFN
ncbi:MAG TPA: M20/M25/M40 family metallo-hydrolase, partial [Bacillales bacterium]|nr:M20/M25/M40 family metallo-hydrolase [Bacillales bacterium]